MITRCFSAAGARLPRLVFEQLEAALPGRQARRIVIKPNWVLHQTDPAFPISALVTDARVIEAIVEGCLRCFPSAESILIADCPLQYADWPLLCQQSGLAPIMDRLMKLPGGKVAF